MLKSAAATRSGIVNDTMHDPDRVYVEINMLRTARFVQSIRDGLTKKLNKETPVIILSGYRSPDVNRLVGGSKTSAHMRGLAADIRVDGMSCMDLAHFITQNFPSFDQVILEFGQWVHVGLAESNPRGQILTAKKVNGRTVYLSGLLT